MSNSTLSGISHSREGFHKWLRMPIGDLPLIRPPKRHMLAQMTGGLQELYIQIKKTKSRPGSTLKESPLGNALKRATSTGDGSDRKGSDFVYNKDSKSLKYDNEHYRPVIFEHEEDSSLYTDEEGEFVPAQNMPLLAHRYKYVNVLARGQSALIIKALDTFAKNMPIAIKVLHRIYKPIGSQEADILIELDRSDPWCHVPFTRLKNQFIYGPHYCLVFESLSPTPLYTHYKQKNIRGNESIPQVQNLCIKLLSVLGFLHKQNVIHADFKPENILLKDENDMNSITVIDFGNSLRNTEEELSLYYSDFELQTLLYRAPEVIFGLKFSLQIDLWSLGCLLAECFTGQPLFIGKTKHDMLSKITKLLGPFPIEFSDGDCARNFREFIGTPLPQHQRIENLKKKLDCSNMNFLILLERLLAYSPQIRINPFEAASHSFVAKINPFLYLSSAGERRYPTILLNSQTYPHLPTFKTSSNEDKLIAECRKRLATYSNQCENDVKAPITQKMLADHDNQEKKRDFLKINPTVDSKPKICQPLKKELQSQPFQHQKDQLDIPSQFDGIKKSLDKNDRPNDICDKKDNIQDSSYYKESFPIKSPGELSNERQSICSPEMQHSLTSESSMQSPVGSPPLFNSLSKSSASQINSSVEITRHGNKSVEKSKEQFQGDVSRTDVKQTLKSMGLRCEDFTISVYSREQAHAILRKQGVEVTNHNQNKLNVAKTTSRIPKANPNVHPSVSVLRREQQTKQTPPEQQTKRTISPDLVKSAITQDSQAKTNVPSDSPAKPTVVSEPQVKTTGPPESQVKSTVPPKVLADNNDDDDDCVILDPPEGPKKILPQRRFPQQFQLMGTTVKVNRGAKRPLRGVPTRPPAKRGRPTFYNFFNDSRQTSEDNSESSVQETLNRLKNYNISITCKRNTAQMNPPKSYYKDDEYENSDSNSDEEQDLAKFLECEIKEKNPDENEDDDCNEPNSSYNDLPNQEDKENNIDEDDASQDGFTANDCANNDEADSHEMKHCNMENDESDYIKHNSPVANGSKDEVRTSSSIDDDEINEELEKQLLEPPNFAKEFDDIEDDCLDSLEKEM